MSSTDSSADDHAYFQAIEESFIGLRGAPLLLAPSDWQLAKRWHQQGIPLGLVLETLEAVFAARQARGAKGKVQGLRYCASAVEKAWLERQELAATGKRQEAPTLELPERLRRLSESLLACESVTEDLARRVAALEGTPENIEAALQRFDQEMIEMVMDRLDVSSLDEIKESIETSLTKLRSRLGESESARVRDRLMREAVRRRLDLPVLSLFAVGPTSQ